MQGSTLLSWRFREKNSSQALPWEPRKESFFEKRQVGQVISSLMMSSLLWGLLAFGVYAVYSLVLGSH